MIKRGDIVQVTPDGPMMRVSEVFGPRVKTFLIDRNNQVQRFDFYSDLLTKC